MGALAPFLCLVRTFRVGLHSALRSKGPNYDIRPLGISPPRPGPPPASSISALCPASSISALCLPAPSISALSLSLSLIKYFLSKGK